MPTIRSAAALAVVLALVGAACGDDAASDTGDAATTSAPATTEATTASDEATAAATTDGATGTTAATVAAGTTAATQGFPVTIESAGGTFTLSAPPERIVSLSPSATEILFAIGAGDQVVAADQFSNYPEDAPTTDLSGFDPNVEAVLAFEPDLVVIANDANDLVAGLTNVDVPVYVDPAPLDIESGYPQMAEFGIMTGHVDDTAEAIATMRSEIDEALAAAPDTPIRIFHELDETHFSVSSFGFLGAIYAEMGTVNIADEADTDQTGFPQLTEEYIVEADPELIVITDQVAYGADDVAARPGWENISGVANGNIVVVEADTASRWGPRLPQFIGDVAEALAGVAEPATS